MILKIVFLIIIPLAALISALRIYKYYYLPATDYRSRLKIEILLTISYLLAGYFIFTFIEKSENAVLTKEVFTGAILAVIIWFRISFIRYLIRKINFSH